MCTHFTHLCVCLKYYVSVYLHADNTLINVCEDSVCKMQGGVSGNLPQVLVSRIPPVPINKRPK